MRPLTYLLAAILVGLILAVSGCGGINVVDEGDPGAQYIRIVEGEAQGQFTNSEARGCVITFGNFDDVPFDEFQYSRDGCSVRGASKGLP